MKLLVSAIEPSANLHLKEVVHELNDVEIMGVFDESLGKPIVSPHEFGVMGLIDVLAKIKKAKSVIKEMVVLAQKVDKVLLIDAPAFNLPLAKAIKEAYPTKEIIYYILPKVWAWKKKRALKVMKYTDKQLSIFPFEDQFYPTATYVGNPLMDEITCFKEKLTDNNTIAYLAGSRKSEIKRLMPILKELRSKLGDKKALLVIPPHLSEEQIDSLYGDISMFEVSRDTHKAVSEASFAFVCSGTATFETALIGTPFVLLYKANALEFKIGRMIVKLPNVGLANIMFDFAGLEPMHPEFLQNDLIVEDILDAYRSMDREKFFEKSLALRTMLGSGTNKKVAKIISN